MSKDGEPTTDNRQPKSRKSKVKCQKSKAGEIITDNRKPIRKFKNLASLCSAEAPGKNLEMTDNKKQTIESTRPATINQQPSTKSMKVPRLRFREFEGEWEEFILGNLYSPISSGKSRKSEIGPVQLYGSTGLIGYSEQPDYSGRKLLVARVGANAGYIYLVNGNYGVTDNTLILSQSSSNLDFLYFRLLNYNLNSLVFGSGQPLITGGQISKIRLNFPSLTEQSKIVSFISAVTSKIEFLQKKKTLLEQYKKGMMQRIFSGEVRFRDEEGKEFGEWESKALQELGGFIGGGTPSTTESENYSGSIPWISSSDLTENDVKAIAISRYITDEAIANSATNLIPANSVLIVSRVGVGKVAVNSVEVCTSQDFTNFVPGEEANSLFIAYLLSFKTNELLSLMQGTSIKGFVKSDLEKLEVKMPQVKEQTQIANFLSAIDEKIGLVEKEIEGVGKFKKGLLGEMFV